MCTLCSYLSATISRSASSSDACRAELQSVAASITRLYADSRKEESEPTPEIRPSIPGARVTDFMAESKLFIAVTEAEVWELEVAGRQLMSAPFLNVNREHIQVIAPGH